MNATNTANTSAAASLVITKHYAKRDPEAQGDHYISHVSAMTGEGLHAKSDIAAELAHRDIEIERLQLLDAERHGHYGAALLEIDRLRAALIEARCAINSMKVEAETACVDGDEQMLQEACETISNEGLAASMAIDAALALTAPAQPGEYPPLVCDYCGTLTPDPWHSSGTLHGKMSKHIHSCDACCAARAAQGGAA